MAVLVGTYKWPIVDSIDHVYTLGAYRVCGYEGDPGLWDSAGREAGKAKTWLERGRPTW